MILHMSPSDSYLVFDVETTGLNPRSDRIIQVGLCKVCDGVVTERSGWLVNQEVDVPPEARMVHGITTADIRARGIPPHESLARLLGVLSTAPSCVGHNIHRFDILFLIAECRRLGVPVPEFGHFVDTAALYKGWKLNMERRSDETFKKYADRVLETRAPGLKFSLATCLQFLGIQTATAQLHQAGDDAFLTHLVFEALKKVVPADSSAVQTHV